MGNGPAYYGPSARYVPKTRVELAREQKDIALQNLVIAAKRLTDTTTALTEAKLAEHEACTCCPQHGGK
jgi:hypothetical protein